MKESQASALAAQNARIALYNSGTLNFYNGNQPATPDTAISGNTNLLTLTFAATAFGAASETSGQEQSNASFVSNSGTAGGTGTNNATFARALKSDGTTVLGDFSVGDSATPTFPTSSISGTTLTLGAPSQGHAFLGMAITSAGVAPGTIITGFGSGTGGAGTYTVSVSQTVSSMTMVGSSPDIVFPSIAWSAGTTITLSSFKLGSPND